MLFRATWRQFRLFSSDKKKDLLISKTGPIESLPAKPSSVDPVSAAPKQIFKERVALIYRPARNVMQSGSAQTKHWRLEFNPNVPRWENPLMGWSSSRDPIQGVTLKFTNKEDAVKYAQDQGWAVQVKDEPLPPRRPKSYAENFTYSPGKLKIIKTK